MPAIYAGYTYWLMFGYVKDADKTGPYAISSAGVATLIGSGGGGGGAPELEFNAAANSQYLALISVGGM